MAFIVIGISLFAAISESAENFAKAQYETNNNNLVAVIK